MPVSCSSNCIQHTSHQHDSPITIMILLCGTCGRWLHSLPACSCAMAAAQAQHSMPQTAQQQADHRLPGSSTSLSCPTTAYTPPSSSSTLTAPLQHSSWRTNCTFSCHPFQRHSVKSRALQHSSTLARPAHPSTGSQLQDT